MDPLRSASVAPVAAERHPLQPPSPPAEGADEAFAAADADFFLDWMASEHFFHGATPPLVAPPDAQLSGLPLLRALARQGAWRAVIERAKEALITPGLSRDLELSCVAYHAWALTKLRMYGSAADVLRAAGDPDAAPNLDADGRSLAPFALLWLQAELPQHLGAPSATQDALCALHTASCALRSAALVAGDARASALAARRADMALYALVAFHASRHEWRSALLWLDAVSRSAPSDPTPLAASGLLFLQIGDMVAASAATDAAEAACSVADAVLAEQGRAAVARNRALLRVAAKDYAGARDAFAAALAARPWDAVAANNAAVAALYCADLPAAVDILERALAAHPLAALQEPLVLNLCSLYELSAGDAAAAKRRLAAWVARAGPECFDGACTRL